MMAKPEFGDAGPALCLRECAGAGALANELAGTIADALRRAIAGRGQAMLAVSGGKSPLVLFAALREQHLAWDQVTVLLADERCVHLEHADSNAALVRTHLLQGRAAAARWAPFFNELPDHALSDAELDGLARAANLRLQALPWPIDVLVLGMGEDAHTASLFPGAAALPEAMATGTDEDAFLLVPDPLPPEAPFPRITLTLSRLVATRSLLLMITGEAKRAVLELFKRLEDLVLSSISIQLG